MECRRARAGDRVLAFAGRGSALADGPSLDVLRPAGGLSVVLVAGLVSARDERYQLLDEGVWVATSRLRSSKR